jgi:hypothetical protein
VPPEVALDGILQSVYICLPAAGRSQQVLDMREIGRGRGERVDWLLVWIGFSLGHDGRIAGDPAAVPPPMPSRRRISASISA